MNTTNKIVIGILGKSNVVVVADNRWRPMHTTMQVTLKDSLVPWLKSLLKYGLSNCRRSYGGAAAIPIPKDWNSFTFFICYRLVVTAVAPHLCLRMPTTTILNNCISKLFPTTNVARVQISDTIASPEQKLACYDATHSIKKHNTLRAKTLITSFLYITNIQ